MLNTIKEKIIMLIYKGVIVSLVLGFLIQTVAAFPLYAFVVNEDEIERVSINTVNEVDEEDIKLLYEIEEYRSDFLKVFKRSDGKLEYAYYDEQANYFNGDKYVEVDALFTENGNDFDSVVNKYSVKIPKKINENKKIKLAFDDASIELTYNDIKKSTGTVVDNSNEDIDLSNLKKLKGEVLYSNIFDDVDLKLSSTGSYFKENIILNKYIENFSFEYSLKLKKLTLVKDENSIKFINNNNEVVYTIDPYFMIDDSSKVSYEIDVKYELIKDNEYKFIVTPSDKYLREAKYPVVIDPVFKYESNSTTSSLIRTKTIWKNLNTVFDSSIQLTKYINVTDDYTENISHYGLIEVNFLGLPDFDKIHSATLTLRGNSQYYDDPVVVRRINTSRIYSNLSLDNINGMTEYVTYSETFEFNNLGNYLYGINLTNYLNENEFYEHNGVVLFELSPECFSGNEVSQYYNSHMSSSYKPYLSIIVLEDTGLSPYRTYEEISYGDGGSYYIDRLNGYGIFSLPVNNEFNLPFNYYYSSLEKDINKGFGKGFNLSVSESVERLTYNELIYYCLTDGTGYKEYFYYDETNQKYCSEAGDNGYLIVNNDIVYYYKDDIVKQYNSDGLLSCITYEYVNNLKKENTKIYLYYDSENNISKIECGNYQISLNYEEINGYKVLTYCSIINKITNNTDLNSDQPSIIYKDLYSLVLEYDDYGKLKKLEKYKDDYRTSMNAIYASNLDSYRLQILINSYKNLNQVENCYFEYDEDNYLSKAFTSNGINEYVDDPEAYEGIYVTYEDNQITNYGIKVKTQTSLKELMSINYYENSTEFIDYTGYKKTYSFDYFGHTISLFDSDGYAICYEYENFAGELGKSNPNYLLKNQIKTISDPLNVLNNPILNSSFEDYNGIDEIPYWTEAVEGQDTGRVVEGNDVPFGEKVLELSNSSSKTIDYEVYQTVSLSPGAYNISAFVKVGDNIYNNIIDYVGYIKIKSSSGEILNESPCEFNNPEYKLITSSFRVSESMEVKIICGIKSNSSNYELTGGDRAYFDNIQITNNVINNLPNIIPNHSFESNSNWSKGSCGFFERPNIYNESDITKLFGLYELNVPYLSTATQDFFYNTSSFEKFNLGGFARYVDGYGDLRLSVRFYNSTSGVTSSYYELKFSNGCSSDVYASSDLIIDEGKDVQNTYNKIEIKIKNYGISTCKIDNIHLMQINNSKSYNYNENGFVSNVETENETISYEYYENGKIKTITTESSIYEITETEDELGEIAEYSTLIKEKDFNGNVTSSFKESTLFYHVDENLGSDLVYETTDYIAQLKILSDNDGFASQTASIYNIKTNLIVASYDEFGYKTKYEYDNYNRLIKTINTINEGDDENEYDVYTEYVYNNDNSVNSITSGISQDDGILKAKKITYQYDENGNIVKIILNNDNMTFYMFEYDEFNYLTKVYHNETKLIEYVYLYDENIGINTGLVLKEIKNNGEYILYTYRDNFTVDSCSKGIINENGEIEEKLCYNILYDEYGRVGYYVDHFDNKSYYYNYDYNGNLIKINVLNNNKEDIQSDNHDYISFVYNENNDILSITYYFNGETLTDYFYYDENKELSSIRVNDFVFTNPKECIEGLTKYVESSISYVNGDETKEIVKELAYYDNTDDVWSIAKQKEDSTGTHFDILGNDIELHKLSSRICKQEFFVGSNPNMEKYKYTYSYTYDEFGNINSITYDDPTGSSKDRKYLYSYELNELRYEIVMRGDEILLVTNYTYDSYGNITNIKRSFPKEEYANLPAKQEFTYNALNQLVSYKVDGVTVASDIQYDENGNPLSLADYSLTFEDGKLVQMTNSNNTITYEYNSLGVRTKKIVNGIVHEYVTYGDMILSEIISKEIDGVTVTDEIQYLYDANGTAIGFVYGTGNYYYIRNLTGEITHIVNEDSMIFGEYRYDAYGNIINEDSLSEIAQINSIRYKGYYYDVETNLFLVSSRYYSPELCRWISPDDIEYLDPESVNGLNLYCYCLNNPIMYVDPTGHFAMTAFGIWAIIGIVSAAVVIGGGAQLASNALAGETGSDLWRGVAGAAIGSGVNALALCLSPFTGGASLAFAAGLGAIAQTGVDTIETLIRGEDVSLLGTALDLGLNFATTFAGNWIGSKLVPTNAGWFKPQKFLSVFTKPYGQKILLQTVIGAGLSAGVNFVRKFDWSSVDWKKFIPVIPVPVVPTYPYF